MNQLYTSLPDDRPIAALSVVENPDKRPNGWLVVSKTYDQDIDADLWRESGFFGRKCTRYLCLTKDDGTEQRVIEALTIISEKEKPPTGYTVLSHTFDTGNCLTTPMPD